MVAMGSITTPSLMLMDSLSIGFAVKGDRPLEEGEIISHFAPISDGNARKFTF